MYMCLDDPHHVVFHHTADRTISQASVALSARTAAFLFFRIISHIMCIGPSSPYLQGIFRKHGNYMHYFWPISLIIISFLMFRRALHASLQLSMCRYDHAQEETSMSWI